MAEQPTILRGDKGTASRLALGTLSVLVGIQVALVAWDFIPKSLPALNPPASPPAQASPVSTSIAALPPPVAPAQTQYSPGLVASLPPPPGMLIPGASGGLSALPPPPGQLGNSPPPASTSLPKPVPAPSVATPPPAPTRVSAPTPPPAPAAPVSLTGSPEVDEIIATARETIALNDPTATQAALETLQRADLLLPDHPVVLREMALAHQKLKDPAKAQELFARANAASSRTAPVAPVGFGSGSGAAPHAPLAEGTLNNAFANNTSPPPPEVGPLSLGKCEVKRDFTCTTGERQILRVELKAMPGAVINPDNINIDVFFYDAVDNTRVEQSRCDKPVWKFDLPVDFKDGGVEIVDVTYHMPRMNDAEIREHGKRAYHGFLAKLYYEGKPMGDHVEPKDLRSQLTGSTLPGSAPAQP